MKWYQEAIINGVKMVCQRKNDTNQKRWDNLIYPLVPQGGGSFLELGSNAGFYLRKAAEIGYRMIGVELSKDYVAHARYWEENDPKGVVTVEGDINDYDIPATTIVLLANVHYWLTPDQVKALVKKLREYVLYVLVVGRFKADPKHKSPCDVASLAKIFNGWIMSGIRHNNKHFSRLFRNPDLCEVDTDTLFKKQQFVRSRKFLSSFSYFIQKVLSGETFNPMETDYFKYIKKQKVSLGSKDFVRVKISLIKDIAKNGIKEPLFLGKTIGKDFYPERLFDGDHRLIIAQWLGIKKVICRYVVEQVENGTALNVLTA